MSQLITAPAPRPSPGAALRAWGFLLRAPALRGSPARSARRLAHLSASSQLRRKPGGGAGKIRREAGGETGAIDTRNPPWGFCVTDCVSCHTYTHTFGRDFGQRVIIGKNRRRLSSNPHHPTPTQTSIQLAQLKSSAQFSAIYNTPPIPRSPTTPQNPINTAGAPRSNKLAPRSSSSASPSSHPPKLYRFPVILCPFICICVDCPSLLSV